MGFQVARKRGEREMGTEDTLSRVRRVESLRTQTLSFESYSPSLFFVIREVTDSTVRLPRAYLARSGEEEEVRLARFLKVT